VVFKFAIPMSVGSASVAPAPAHTAEVDGPPVVSPDGKEVRVNLKNVADAQRLAVSLAGVNDGTNTANVSVPMAVLVGDTTANESVNASDVAETKAQSGQPVSGSNFRLDVTVNGQINSSDISLVKSRSGAMLP
jgi:hypothetical protein